MPRTLASAIIASRTRQKAVEGEICRVRVDFAFANDITAPPAVRSFRKMGAKKVFDPARCAILPDHFTPNKDIASAEQAKTAREFALEQGMLYWEQGRVGIEHAFLPEKGLILPGEVVTGADSHTCTGGTLGAFATGMGSTDLAAVWALGETWLRVPETIRIVFEGRRPPWISGKDLILEVLRRIGVQGARYRALEFGGPAVKDLPLDDRFTVANMAVETGAKTGLFVPDETSLAYASARAARPFAPVYPDSGAGYVETHEIDVGGLQPLVALPHIPSNVRPAAECGKDPIHQVFIGSCTNGRLRDLEQAALLLKGRQVHPSVRCIVIPASPEIFRAALERDFITAFTDAGAVVCTPTCGPCLGGHMGVLAGGERCVSTSNRNFKGRMGHPGSEVILAGPLVAAASALKGRITDPREILSEEEFQPLEVASDA
ncbi:MAG: 3-isopropylmalate dehydratase large subunit [Thermovirgaceae bacterium]|nr:3-isopropylmalate dehydratase large subunit [Thermovirgaceae bacterium]